MNNKPHIDANRDAWNSIAGDHYETFLKRLSDPGYELNLIIKNELGDIEGKRLLHLQCNTGGASILLARMGALVTGVDIAPDNIRYARKLAEHFEIDNISFIESDIMELLDKHEGEYDIVFTSDGAIGWLPDLTAWAKTIKHFLAADGFFYMHDAHPFYSVFEPEQLAKEQLVIGYPYFGQRMSKDDYIGGYACDARKGENYWWEHSLSEITNSLANQQLFIEYIHEYAKHAKGMGGTEVDENDLAYYPFLLDKIPLSMSLKATHR